MMRRPTTLVYRWLHDLTERIERLESAMSEVQGDQAKLDADVAAESASLDAVEAEIAALKSQPPAAALDFSKLDGVVSRLKGDEPPAPAA